MTVINDEVVFRPINNVRLANLCGQFDQNIRFIESSIDVEIGSRGDSFFFSGAESLVECAKKILHNLYELAESRAVHFDDVHLEVRNAGSDEPGMLVGDQSIQAGRSFVRARGANQKRYLSSIKTNDISFGVGPAGTGKTYLAVAAAVDALENDRVSRVCLVRPAVEAGERLGFLPGDMAQKIDPYMRPLYDALYEMLGFEKVALLLERNIIEIAPLAFMRGRTLNESFVILDEAQNTTTEQMKMFLTRLGFGSQAVITGDVTQIDLPHGRESGLKEALDVLEDVPGISFTFFKSKDVVRHSLVAKILDAYAEHE
jgi:phosphate starvation-inducible protein PhoH and related proteins